MFKRLISFFIACLFLGGSILLPLGDFSLMRDIPGMYHNYTKITTPEELSVIDFIGDYMLHGKELLNHNKHDKPQSTANNVQFQHQANQLNVVLSTFHSSSQSFPVIRKKQNVYNKSMATSDYHQELFRPPLA
jgi:hypothetical protein